jgi:D-cysteine desulfhydrase
VEPHLPALLEAFPALRRRLPRHAFLSGATPVEPFALPGSAPGQLFVKRDDRSCPLYGGNKPRKLEFLIGAARARGARRLVTSGGLGTNHGLATTLLGRSAGLATTVVMVWQPPSQAVRRTLLQHAAWGAELVYGRNVPGSALQLLRVLARSSLRGERPYLSPPGGSSSLGNLGFVSAGLELARQVREGALPEPAELWVAVGTGGSLAGLVAGLRLAELKTRVVGVLVTDILPPSPRRLARRASAALRRLHRVEPAVPHIRFAPRDFTLLGGEVGPGYGAPTPAAVEAVAAAAEAGLQLETTYTGKCLGALRRRLERPCPGPLLFWNTYNSVDLAAPGPDAAALPPRFRRLLEGGR